MTGQGIARLTALKRNSSTQELCGLRYIALTERAILTCFSSHLSLGALDQRLGITETQKGNTTDALSSHCIV